MAAISPYVQDLVDSAVGARYERWEHTRCELVRLLRTALADCDLDDDGRVVVQDGRVKQPARLADKLQQKLDGQSGAVELDADAIEELVRDIVGTRIVCKTLRDVRIVEDALRRTCGVTLRMSEEPRNYIDAPKESGYRSVHFHLSVPVSEPAGEARTVCEVQVRTMMQDAWGELTHENSYKAGELALPNLYLEIARHMANMMHEVDELANTLAEATDRLRAEVEEEQSASGADEITPDLLTVGDVYVGRVVSTGPDYALVLIEPFRGLLGTWEIKKVLRLDQYIEASDYVAVGDMIRARVIEHEEGRLLLAPADAAEMSRHAA